MPDGNKTPRTVTAMSETPESADHEWQAISERIIAHTETAPQQYPAGNDQLTWTTGEHSTTARTTLLYPDPTGDTLTRLIHVETLVAQLRDTDSRGPVLRTLAQWSGLPCSTAILTPEGEVKLTFALPCGEPAPHAERYIAEAIRQQQRRAPLLQRALANPDAGAAPAEEHSEPLPAPEPFSAKEAHEEYKSIMASLGMEITAEDHYAIVVSDPADTALSVAVGTSATATPFGSGIALLATTGVGLPRATPQAEIDATINAVNYLIASAPRLLALPVAHTSGATLEIGTGTDHHLALGGFLPLAALEDHAGTSPRQQAEILAHYTVLAYTQARLVFETAQ